MDCLLSEYLPSRIEETPKFVSSPTSTHIFGMLQGFKAL